MLIFHCDVSLPDGMKRDEICLHDEVWIQFEFQGELLKNRRTLVEASLPPNPKRYSAPVGGQHLQICGFPVHVCCFSMFFWQNSALLKATSSIFVQHGDIICCCQFSRNCYHQQVGFWAYYTLEIASKLTLANHNVDVMTCNTNSYMINQYQWYAIGKTLPLNRLLPISNVLRWCCDWSGSSDPRWSTISPFQLAGSWDFLGDPGFTFITFMAIHCLKLITGCKWDSTF